MEPNLGNEEQRRISEWITQSKEAAKHLIDKVDGISDKMFKAADLSNFIMLVSRFTYLDYRNLLLLSAQYPNATDLAGASTWKSFVPKGSLFLKEEFQGKGISLIAPFSEIYKNTSLLTWFTINMYDISQTKVIKKQQTSPIYLLNRLNHIKTLLMAVRLFIAEEFYFTFREMETEEHIKSGLPCFIKNRVIYVNPKSDEIKQLSFLLEYIVKMNTDEIYEKELVIYLSNEVRNILFEIWDLPKQVSYAPPYEILSLADIELQKNFLDTMQTWVRTIEDCVLREYQGIANEKDIIYNDII